MSGYERNGPPVEIAFSDADRSLQLPDGRTLVLMGIEMPTRETSWRQNAKPDVADEASQMLASILTAGPLTLWQPPNAGPDRWGRVQALASSADGRLVQVELLRHGLARVMPARSEDDAALPLLLEAEAPARTAQVGLWSHPRYAVRKPGDLSRLIDSYQVVEGRIVSANITKNAVYLNLGSDKRRDLGIRIAKRTLKKWDADPGSWVGRTIRVRGFVGKSIGPLIELWHRGQIEFVSDPAP